MFEELVRRIGALERRLDGLVLPEVARCVDWTPTVTQSGSVAVTINRARYQMHGKWIHIMCNLTVTGTGTGGNAILLAGWPTAINAVSPGSYAQCGTGGVLRSGINYYPGLPGFYGAVTTIAFWHQNNGNYLGVNPNFALAANDEIYLNAAWEIA